MSSSKSSPRKAVRRLSLSLSLFPFRPLANLSLPSCADRHAQLELRHQAVSRVVDTVEPFLRPLAQRAYSAVPLPRIVKDVLFDRAERFLLGDGRVDGAGQGVVCETDEVVEVKRRTSVKAASTGALPPSLP